MNLRKQVISLAFYSKAKQKHFVELASVTPISVYNNDSVVQYRDSRP